MIDDDINRALGLANSPGPINDYLTAFQAGRRIADQGSPPSPVDAAGASMQPLIGQMGAPQRQAAGQAQEQLVAILNGLRLQTSDPAQRLSMARHLAGQNPQMGIDPGSISLADVSDPGIASHVATAMRLMSQLAGSNSGSGGGAAPPPPPPPTGAPAGAPRPCENHSIADLETLLRS